MTIKTVVLDLDGTLIDSNRLKYDAYFAVFSRNEPTRELIRRILAEKYELSRYRILDEIVGQVCGLAGESRKERVQTAASAYNDIVMKGAQECPLIPGALEIMQFLAETEILVYLSSNTPEKYLPEIISVRGWRDIFKEIYGYPRIKAETIGMIMAQEKISANEILVVGDGESDRYSAEFHGAGFLAV